MIGLMASPPRMMSRSFESYAWIASSTTSFCFFKSEILLIQFS